VSAGALMQPRIYYGQPFSKANTGWRSASDVPDARAASRRDARLASRRVRLRNEW